jgi:hypothetical protein
VLVVVGGRSTSALTELKDLNEQATGFKGEIAKIEPQLKMLKHKVESRRVLAEQPNAGELMALIAGCVEEDVVLRQMQVNATGIGGPNDFTSRSATPGLPVAIVAGSEREPRHFEITLRGMSKSEKGMSRMSDKLKALGLFDEVDLKGTGRDASGVNAVSFEVVCLLRDGGAAAGVAAGGISAGSAGATADVQGGGK